MAPHDDDDGRADVGGRARDDHLVPGSLSQEGPVSRESESLCSITWPAGKRTVSASARDGRKGGAIVSEIRLTVPFSEDLANSIRF
jgi:hypothetical protein